MTARMLASLYRREEIFPLKSLFFLKEGKHLIKDNVGFNIKPKVVTRKPWREKFPDKGKKYISLCLLELLLTAVAQWPWMSLHKPKVTCMNLKDIQIFNPNSKGHYKKTIKVKKSCHTTTVSRASEEFSASAKKRKTEAKTARDAKRGECVRTRKGWTI